MGRSLTFCALALNSIASFVLQAHFGQINAQVNLNPPRPALSSCYQCPPRLVPQLYFGQVGIDIMTPQPFDFGF